MSVFIDSFGLFWETYLTAILASFVLASLGVLAVTRGQIFVSAAIAQASLLGIGIALSFGWESYSLSAIVISVLAALFVGRKVDLHNNKPDEKTAWVFLLSASLSVLLLTNLPNGMRQLQSLSSSSILSATVWDLVFFGILFLLCILFLVTRLNHLILYVSDVVMAAAVGMNISLWAFGVSCATGVACGLSIQSGGLLFTFGSMILPALSARNIVGEIRWLFILSPILASFGTFLGLFFSASNDLPPGQTAVFVHSIILVLSWLGRELKFWIRK